LLCGDQSIGGGRRGERQCRGCLMRDIEVRDLLELAARGVENPDEKLTQLYLWMYDYSMVGAKALTAFGASLLAGLALAVIQEKSHQIGIYVVLGFLGAGLTIAVGVWRYFKVRKLSQQFMAAHYLLSEVIRVGPFLQLYERERQ
jgi:hypothetical protein